jgi:hypothetical protein
MIMIRINERIGTLLVNTKLDRFVNDPFSIMEEALNKDLSMLVCPEYFFTKPFDIYDSYEKDRIVDDLLSLSRRYQGCIIFPGTIVWKKDGVLRNSVVVFSNGRVIHEHSKHLPIESEKRYAKKFNLEMRSFEEEEREINQTFEHDGKNYIALVCNDYRLLGEMSINKRDYDYQVMIARNLWFVRRHFFGRKIIFCDGGSNFESQKPESVSFLMSSGRFIVPKEISLKDSRLRVYSA